jgi:anti-sigma B factor antagonist
MAAGAQPPQEPSLDVTASGAPGDPVRIAVSGEVDIATAPALREALEEAINGSSHDVELDLGECAFVDSTGLQVIVLAGRSLAQKGRSLVLERPQEQVQRLFLTAAIDRIEGLRLEGGTPPADL